ncbi:isopentenyl phosphate kinase [Methanobrevibacter sp.]|uniref:isopentenyl phosphate kinase n=1 Tax=Methanobrevibacter sp. TaxID=66852 RepID=UPI0025CE98BF|nr:isopentenyl phosphate kinase [Methanobrevibacter sp.]MBQ6098819.1 isopentenyl phosphate kinase family protein [Methanobrevibacter sp.]MBQ6511059.1 isopentenyl phosphate kinase family protein [Methanobrevibacter sp.]
MIILKIGGSILTNKDSAESEIDSDSLKRIAGEIKSSLDKSDKQLIIVHGAGSFGHPPAKEYKIGEVFDESELPQKRIGFCKTQNAVKKLNMLICEAFIEEDLPVVAIPASSFMTATNKRITKGNLESFKNYLSKGFIPVIYGDVVLDSELEICVISGDQLIQYLAVNLNPDKVILGTDVDGVYNKNPKTHDDAIFFEKFSSIEDLDTLEGTTNVDVTGGMVGKIKELLYLADLGIESMIINAEVKNNIFKVLEDEKVKGTIISRGN